MSSLGIVTHTLASAVADDATVAIAYPTGLTAADLRNATGGTLTVGNGAYGAWDEGASGFEVTTLGASTITITNRSGMSWPAGEDIIVSFGNTPRVGSYNVTVGREDGQAAAGTALSQELTASGAVDAGVQNLRLNHATVVIAATIADAADHAGLMTITDTSASGTAAHTVTLTEGTFDGTNNTATFNAPAESLVVFFDEDGNGTIVVNTGAVVLSSV